MSDKVFIDSDIILDFLLKREPYHVSAAHLFLLIQRSSLRAYTSTQVLVNLDYILSKLKTRQQSIKILQSLSNKLRIIGVSPKATEFALSTTTFKDFEDAVQYHTAIENKLEYIITRNKKDYKGSKLPVCTAAEYMASYNMDA